MSEAGQDQAGDTTRTAPHPFIQTDSVCGDEWADSVRHVFDATAVDYDRIERIVGLGSGRWYRRQALRRAGLVRGMRVVDVGFGTGLVAEQAIDIIGDSALLTGVDPSVGMLQASALAGKVQLLTGRAEELPLADDCADFVSMGYALRYLSDLNAAFAEFRRVLRPGGRICLLEITKPTKRWQCNLLRTYIRSWMPLAARLSGAITQTPRIWRYYWDSIDACTPPARIVELLRAQGMTEVRTVVELGVFYEYHARVPL